MLGAFSNILLPLDPVWLIMRWLITALEPDYAVHPHGFHQLGTARLKASSSLPQAKATLNHTGQPTRKCSGGVTLHHKSMPELSADRS